MNTRLIVYFCAVLVCLATIALPDPAPAADTAPNVSAPRSASDKPDSDMHVPDVHLDLTAPELPGAPASGMDPLDSPNTLALPQDPGTLSLCRGDPKPITLEECIALVMRRNVNIRVAYLDRVLQKFDLVTDTAYTFAPKVSLDGSLIRRGSDDKTDRHVDYTRTRRSGFSQTQSQSTLDTFAVSPQMSGLVPTGARYSVSWSLEDSREHSRDRDRQSGALGSSNTGWDPTGRRGLENVLRMSITQPLLKGAGLDYNLASVKQAVITEKVNVLRLKSNIVSELTAAIKAYRQLLSARWNVAISANSLQRAQDNLETARIKIEMGRMAAVDIVQYEADEANRQLSLEQARNSYNTARLNLLQSLDLERDLCLEPSETLDFAPLALDIAKLRETAFESKPDYLTRLLNLRSAELDLLQARRDSLWDLSFTFDGSVSEPGSFTDARGQNTRTKGYNYDWSFGLKLSIPVFGSDERSPRRRVLQAKSTLHVNRIQLEKYKKDLLNELEQRLDTIQLLERQVELSQRSRILADKKLEVERFKLEKGRSSTFQLVTFQDQQFQAQQNELNARISYLDALADLDSFLGTTMETWHIEFAAYSQAAENEIFNVRWGADDTATQAEPLPARELASE